MDIIINTNKNSNNSLADYVLKNYKDTIFSSLYHFFKANKFYASIDEYENPDIYDLSIDVKVNNIISRYFKAPNDMVDFDIKLDCNVEVADTVGGDLQVNYFEDTYTLGITARLNNGLHDLNITEIKYGSHMRDFDEKNCVSQFLTPYIKKIEYEEYAHEFLELYYPEALEEPIFVNPLIILKKMGLNLFFAKLDDDVNGKILFRPEKASIFDYTNKEFVISNVPERSILINIKLIKNGRGILNNTIIHECVHWWLHKKYFELQMLLNPGDSSLSSYKDMENVPQNEFINKHYMELQARSISPLILMPQKASSKYYEYVLYTLKHRKEYHSTKKTYLYALYLFAEKFGASTSCARLRLENLGYTECSFCSELGNALGTKPYTSSLKLDVGQTFLLSFSDAITALNKEHNVKLALIQGKILYVDGFFVINDEKYVKFYKNVKPKLTALALKDVSKCCLLFDTKKEGISVEFNPKVFNFENFCSGGSKTKYVIHPSIANTQQNKELLDLKRNSIKARNEIEEARILVNKMKQYESFPSKLNFLMGEEGLNCGSERKIGALCHVSGKTITSYRLGKSKPDEKTLFAICGGLKLHPLVARTLISARGFYLETETEPPIPFYLHLLNTCYKSGLDCWNELIKETYPQNQDYIL